MGPRITRHTGHLSIVIVGLLANPFSAHAQGLVQADVLPAMGETWHMRALQGVPVEPALVHDMVWPYSDLVGNDVFGVTHTVVAPSTVSGSAAYPEADRAILSVPDDGSSTSHSFYDVTEDRCLELGALNGFSSTVFQPGALAYAYPLEVGEAVDNTFCYTVFTSSGSIEYCGTSRVEVLAKGTLELSYRTFQNVQLVKASKVVAAPGGGYFTTTCKEWYAPGIPYPLLQITTFINSDGNTTRNGRILDQAVFVGIAEETSTDMLSAFPNPTTGPLTITNDAPGTVDVLSADGRLVHTTTINGTGQHTIPTEHLPNGIYQILFRGTGPQRSAKVVVAH